MCWWTSEEAGDGRSDSRTALLSPVSSRRVVSRRHVAGTVVGAARAARARGRDKLLAITKN